MIELIKVTNYVGRLHDVMLDMFSLLHHLAGIPKTFSSGREVQSFPY